MQEFCCRVAPSLGYLEGTHQEVWGTKEYDPTTDIDKPTVFFGLYGLPDFYALWRHKGPKYILWAGSDIRHFRDGYWLDDDGYIRMNRDSLSTWINAFCQSWVENNAEDQALLQCGIRSHITPSFMGDVNTFHVSENKTDKKRYYSSVSGNDFDLYRWHKIIELARENPDNEYHLYGNTIPYLCELPNVIIHGRVSKEKMNEEIKSMTGCIRLLSLEGCSEIVVKAVLMGQEVISAIDYTFLHSANPREELLKIVNKYPWAQKNI